ncbi:PQQ-binding-like beta-propeller repeat protein [Streptomyces spororaveus]|uniref:outer membrane protein assembly factor BamB family protein n=1 Tax=Streptomyces spororaveus TaxID=284039 RepID=UPI003680AC48
MSIPPPPSQPPSGGFGAPQDPPPGGFGAPVPPPGPDAQPAYGYPQTGPGYGYPQQPGPPPAYGAPGAPGAPGVPGPPVPAPQPPAARAGNDKRTQLTIVGAALLAVVLIVGGGVWYTSGDSGGGDDKADSNPTASPSGDNAKGYVPGTEQAPANTKSKPLANVPSPVPADVAVVAGSWLTDTTYIKSDLSKVVGYNLVDGGKKWELPFPGELCGASKHVSDNKAAVIFKAAQPTPENKYVQCTEVGVFDLESGKLVWSGNAKSATGGDKPVSLTSVTLSGNTVAAAGISAGGAAWSLADGKSLWLPKIDNEGCRDVGYAGGEALAAIRKCGQSPNYTLYGQLLDPATGAPTASYKLSPGIEDANIVATKPLIVAADVGKTAKNATGISDLFVVDPKGELKARIPLASGDFGAKCGTEVEKCSNMVVGNGRIYLPSYEHQGQTSSGRTNELLSFDLETGKQTTDRADAGERFTMSPLRMDGSNIIAYKYPPYDKGGQIVSIDSRTMKETVLMTNPEDKASQRAETGFSPDYSEYRYHKGKFFISRMMVSKPYSAKADPDYLFVSFTAS